MSLFLFSFLLTAIGAQTPYRFGQSAPLTGNERDLGLNMMNGTLAAFHHLNSRGGLWGRSLELITRDDGYEAQRAFDNTLDFLQMNVLGLLSYVGTETVLAAINVSELENVSIPMIAPQTGARTFRIPSKRTNIHIRASYDEEIYEWVAFCQSRGLFIFSVLYEDEPFGRAGLEAITLALSNLGLGVAAPIRYTYNGSAINGSYLNLIDPLDSVTIIPHSVVMVGTHTPLAAFVPRAKAKWPDVLLYSLSFVGSEEFLDDLTALNITQDIAKDIYVGQVVPVPQPLSYMRSHYVDPKNTLLLDFADAMNASCPSCNLTFGALEGYLAGTFVGEILSIMGPFDNTTVFGPYIERLHVTNVSLEDPLAVQAWREFFLDTVYKNAMIDVYGLQLGPWRENITCEPDYVDCFQPPGPPCSQGMQTVFLTQPHVGTHNYTELFEWRLETPRCNIRSEAVAPAFLPLVFGQLASLSGENGAVGWAMNKGIWAAFNDMNLSPQAGVHSRRLVVIAYDDKNSNDQAQANARNLLGTQHVLGIIASTGLETTLSALPYFKSAEIPVYGSASGLRELQGDGVVNVRAQFDDECAAAVDYAFSNNLRKVSLLYQDDIYGWAGIDGMDLAMKYHKSKLFSSAGYNKSTTNFLPALNNISRNGVPDMVVLFTSAQAGAAFVASALNHSTWANTTFFAISYAVFEDFHALLPAAALSSGRVLITTVVPPLLATGRAQIATNYINALKRWDPSATPTHAGLEGYVVGRLLLWSLDRVHPDSVDPSHILAELLDPRAVPLDDIQLGPYTQTCNLGSREVYRVRLGANGTFSSLGAYRLTAPNAYINDCGAYSLQSDEYFDCPDGYSKYYLGDSTLAANCELCLSEFGCHLPEHKTDVSLRAAMLSLNVIGFAVAVVLAAIVVKYRNTVTLKAVSPPFCLLMIGGAGLGYLCIFVLYPAPSAGNCMAQVYLLNASFCLMYGSLFAKVFRVTQIFKPRKTQTFRVLKIQDGALFTGVSAMLAVEMIYCIVWTVVDPQLPFDTHNHVENYTTCRSESNIWVIIDIIVNATVLFYGIMLSFQSRKIPTVFNEAKFVAATMYNTMIIGAIAVLAGDMLATNDDLLYLYKSLGVFIVCTVAMGLLICSKFPSLWKEVRHNKPPVFKKDSSSTKEGEPGGPTTTATGGGSATGSAPNSRLDIKVTQKKSIPDRERGRSSAVDRENPDSQPGSQAGPQPTEPKLSRDNEVAMTPIKDRDTATDQALPL